MKNLLLAILMLLAVFSRPGDPVKPRSEHGFSINKPPSVKTFNILPAVPANILVLNGGTIIDGTGRAPVANSRVIIQGSRILAVDQATNPSLPPDAVVIDGTGTTILPGIINAHIHHATTAAARYRFLASGVTSICDMGSSLRYISLFEEETFRQRQAARGFRAGPIITAVGGYPSTVAGIAWDYQVATPAEAEAAVVTLLSQGADVIKIALEPGPPQQPWPVLSLKQVDAIVTVAHAHSVPVRAHVQQAAMLDIALAAGVDAIEHVPLPFYMQVELEQMLATNGLHLAAQPELEAQLARMAAQDVVMIPTLEVMTRVVEGLPRLKPGERRLTEKFLLSIVGRFREMGGVVALGTDYVSNGPQSRMPVREMELLLAAGFTPLEVIEAGTRHAARICGHGDELGTLEPGKLADLILIDGNPLENIKAMRKVVMVIKGGEIVFIRIVAQ